MNHNIQTVLEERYKTFDDRILWDMPIFYNTDTKVHAFFVVDSHSYNKDGTIDENSINSSIYYNRYPNDEELQFIKDIDDGQIDRDSYVNGGESYGDVQEHIRVYNLLKKYTNEHPMSLRPYNTIDEYLKEKAQKDYDRWHTLDNEIENKKREIAYDRWKDECRGLRYKGAIIYTDDISQNKIMATVIYANSLNDPNYTCRWKCLNGKFINLNQTELNELANLIRDHVQQCYEREEETLQRLYQCKDRDAVKDIYYEEVHEDLINE